MSKQERKKSSWNRILKYYIKYSKGYLWAIYLSVFCYSSAVLIEGSIMPFYVKKIIDGISGGVELGESIYQYTFYIIFILFCLSLLKRFLFPIADYSRSFFQSNVLKKITDFCFSLIAKHSYQFFANNFVGSLVKKSGRFVSSFEDITDIFIFNIFLSLIQIVGTLVILYISSPVLFFIFLIFIVVFLVVSYVFSLRKTKFDLDEAEVDSKVSAHFSDSFTNILNIKTFSSLFREEKEVGKISRIQMEKRGVAWSYQNFIYLIQGVLVSWFELTVIYVSFVLFFDRIITLGTVVVAIAFTDRIISNIWHFGRQLTRLSKALSNASEMLDIIETSIEIVDPEKPEKLIVKDGHIEFNKVSFKYKNGEYIFKDFELRVKPGEKVGIIGTSGAGKTTITKLLLRFADVTKGSIKIDGQDIRDITQDDLRSVISYVPQDPILFHRTLKENIGYGKPSATEAEIMEASKQAHADDFIKGLRDGYQTLVGERGIKLSGGERQRVAIARVILKNAPILILDEATSALDSVSETHIKEALSRLMQGKTTIVIAHRLSTIEKMDRIIVLEAGKIVEEGNHKELLEKRGVYYNFWNHQNGGFIE